MPRRTSTPGVWIFRRKRGGRLVWYARWIDPVTKRRRDVALEPLGLRNAHDRAAWAKAKSDELQAQKRDRTLARHGRTALDVALQAFVDDAKARGLRPRSIAKYKLEAQSLVAWLPRVRGVRAVEEITGRDLWAYRKDALMVKAAPATIAGHMKCVRTVLRWWRKAHLLPQTSPEEISAAFGGMKVDDQPPRPLASPDLRALLVAARGREVRGATMIVVALLTGMRLGELEALRWDQVDLDAPPGGLIQLDAATKTRRGRVIDLVVAPTARELLRLLPREGAFVFGGHKALDRAVAKRWRREAGVVDWTWKRLRQTCESYLVCAPGIGWDVYRAARQLGHTVEVAEKHYLEALRGIPADARTLEAAMGVEAECAALVDRIRSVLRLRGPKPKK